MNQGRDAEVSTVRRTMSEIEDVMKRAEPPRYEFILVKDWHSISGDSVIYSSGIKIINTE